MIEFIYSTLAAAGFTHPLHPVMTHIPMGMVIGAFMFQIASFKREGLSTTAHHCIMLALVFLPLTALFGYMDWQHRYTGFLSNIIIAKIVLAFALLIFLSASVYFFRKGVLDRKVITTIYLLNLLTAAGLGFLGGMLIFG
jgi:uncharacterized membrane protein